MTDIQQAFEDVKAAKIEIARLEALRQKYSNKLADERKALAELEEGLGIELDTIATLMRGARESLQAGLQRINDAPVEVYDAATHTTAFVGVDAMQKQAEADIKCAAQSGFGLNGSGYVGGSPAQIMPGDYDPEEGEGTRGEMRPDDDAVINDAGAAALARVLQA